MTVSRDDPAAARAGDRGYWLVPLVRAILAAVAGLIITFSPEHSAEVGFWVFGLFALVSGAAFAVLSTRALGVHGALIFNMQGVASVVAGVAAIAVAAGGRHPHDQALFLFVVACWAAVTGCLEMYAVRTGGPAGRDGLLVGALTALLALLFVVLPLEIVAAVGLFGAYAVIIGVYLGIGSFSSRGAPRPHEYERRVENPS